MMLFHAPLNLAIAVVAVTILTWISTVAVKYLDKVASKYLEFDTSSSGSPYMVSYTHLSCLCCSP